MFTSFLVFISRWIFLSSRNVELYPVSSIIYSFIHFHYCWICHLNCNRCYGHCWSLNRRCQLKNTINWQTAGVARCRIASLETIIGACSLPINSHSVWCRDIRLHGSAAKQKRGSEVNFAALEIDRVVMLWARIKLYFSAVIGSQLLK